MLYPLTGGLNAALPVCICYTEVRGEPVALDGRAPRLYEVPPYPSVRVRRLLLYSTHRYCKSIAIVGYCVAIATTMPNQSIMGHPLSPPDRRSTAPFSRGDYYGGARAACQTTGSVRTLSEDAYRFLTKILPRNRRFRPLQASDLQVFIFWGKLP